MRKVIFIAFFSISICYGQIDSTRTNYSTDGGGVGYKVTSAQLNGRSIDSLRFFKLTGGTDTNRRVMNVIYSQYGGVFGNGSDMTSRINAMYNKPYVSSVTFAYDTVTVITVSGTVNITKNTEIKGVVSFTGSGTINFNGNILDADPNITIFGPNLTVTGLKTGTGDIPSAWFGAVGNGSTDNSNFFSKAQAAASSYKQTVGLQNGVFQVNSSFTQTVSFAGVSNGGTIIKYNPSSTSLNVVMWTVGSDSIKLSNLTIHGADKVITGIDIPDDYKNITIEYCTVQNLEQYSTSNGNVQGIYLHRLNNNVTIKYCYFDSINAKNTGIARSIRGAAVADGPKNLKILYNVFKGLTNTGAGSNWDCDYICLQDYTDSIGAEIAFNNFTNVSKRAVKAQCSGIYIHDNVVNSDRWKSGSNSSSAFSAYGNDIRIYNNHVNSGSYEKAVDVGAAGTSWNNISIINNWFLLSNAGIGTNDGIRVFGTQNRNITIKGNYIQYVRTGIWIDCSGRDIVVEGNTVQYATSYSISTQCTSNSYPETWIYNTKIMGNTVFKGSAAAFLLQKINTGVFSNNTVDSTSSFLFTTATTLDSVLKVIAEGNVSFNSTSGNPNIGTYASRISIISNPNAWPGLKFVATDRNDSTYMWQGGQWVVIGGGTSGVTSVSPGNGMNFSTITNTGSVTLGNPSTVSISSVNSVSTNSHTHTLDLSGRSIIAGDGIVGGGTLGADRTFTLGTPSNVTLSSTNLVTGTTHTHAFVPGGTAGQLILGNGTLSSSLGSSGYVKYNSGTNDYSTSSTIPYSDITGAPSVSNGEYRVDTLLTLPVLSSFTRDTLIYSVNEDKVIVSGRLTTVATATVSTVQQVILSMPTSFVSNFPNAKWLSGAGTAMDGSGNSFALNIQGNIIGGYGMLLSWKAASSTTYSINFIIQYKYYPGT